MPQSGCHDTVSMCVDILKVDKHNLVFATPSHSFLSHTPPPPPSPVSCTSPVTFSPQTYPTNMAALSWPPLNRVAMWYSRVPTDRSTWPPHCSRA